jgi:hypothetical protein
MFYIIYFTILFLILLYIIYLLRFNKNKISNKKLYSEYNEYFFNKESSEKMTAIIIEPRKHKAFEFVINNFLNNLSDNWNFIIFHGNENKIYIENIIKSLNNNNIDKIQLINLNINNLTLDEYNKLLISKKFYDYIPTEIFLIFQTDSIICEENKDYINKFLNYDYVGAPWKDDNIGNGGLSLRKKSKMLEIIEKCNYEENTPEDVYFALSCPEINRSKPSFKKSQNFSVEAIYNDNSFGVHKPWLHLKKNDYKNMESKCSGLDKLYLLNKK